NYQTTNKKSKLKKRKLEEINSDLNQISKKYYMIVESNNENFSESESDSELSNLYSNNSEYICKQKKDKFRLIKEFEINIIDDTQATI
ncbi:14766_t:CDS:2, partial [Dentiscutata erythropus]